MKRLAGFALVGALGVGAADVRGDFSADQMPFHAHRGWWVNRWEYSNASNIITMLNRAQSIGITDVYFQVRGQADAYYYHNKDAQGNVIEAYAHDQTISASYDPLAIAVHEAHQRGIRLHAWLNVSPLWRGTSMPPSSQHLAWTHDEYWIRDKDGNKMPLNSSYVTVNITRDDVQQHFKNVVQNIAANYAVDGIHLDYVRLLNNHGALHPINYPTDPDTLSRYTTETGNTFDPNNDQSNTTKRNQYKAWMASKITKLVEELRPVVHNTRDYTQLTAAVWRDATIGYNDYSQDWRVWVEQNHLDGALPMIYRKGFGTGGAGMNSDPSDLYRNNVRSAVNHVGNSAVVIGLGTYLQNESATAYNNVMAQLEYARDHGANGFIIYNYGSLDWSSTTTAQGQARLALQDFIAANSTAPPADVIADFEVGEGVFRHNITYSGSNQNVASGSADRVTFEQRSGVASQQIIINKTTGASSFLARHVSGDPTAGSPGSNTTFPSIGSIGFWLKTSTPDLQVAIAVDDMADNSSTERSYFKNVIADGDWHRYEWFLNDVTHWHAWAGANRNGAVASQFTLDSVQFIGTEGANTIYFDDVFFDRAAVAPDQWKFDADGNWSDFSKWSSRVAVWNNGVPTFFGGVPNGVGTVANLLRRAQSDRTITLDVPVTLGTLNIDNSFSYTIAGPNTLTMNVSAGNAKINIINRGNHAITAPLRLNRDTDLFVDRGSSLTVSGHLTNQVIFSGRTINRTGDGTLNIESTQQHGAGAVLNAMGGVTNILTNAGGASDSRTLAVNINGATVNFQTSQHLASLSVGSNGVATLGAQGGGFLVLNALSIAPGGKLDLNDNGLIVDYSGASPYTTLLQYVLDGYRSAPDPTATGIVSSTSQAQGGDTILALVDNAMLATPLSSWAGHAIDSDTVFGKYTYFGDVNLDGQVTGDDFALVVSNLGMTSGAHWIFGDMNFDGQVSGDDVAIVIANLGKGVGNPLGSVQAVPEPTAGVALVAMFALSARRRRICKAV